MFTQTSGENYSHSVLKKFVGVSLALMLLAFAYASIVYVRTYSRSVEPGSYRSFSVSGEGKVVAVPDVAEFTFSLVSQGGKDLGKLQRENTERINRAIGLVKAEGVEDKDIKTEQYSVEPRYQYFNCNPNIYTDTGAARPCPPPEIVGYTVNQTVSVKVRDFEKIGTLLSGVVSAGANSVSQLSFRVDEPAKVESEAREKAIKQAQEKAGAVAKAGGFGVGRLISIQEGGGYYPVYRAMDAKMGFGGGVAESAPAPAVEPGSQDITINVTLVYEIE